MDSTRAATWLGSGCRLPAVQLPSTRGPVELQSFGAEFLVVYIYPRTNVPHEPDPTGWHAIPGARGCTAENCSFRDHERELGEHGARVIGLSSQSLEAQVEFATRMRIPHPLVSDRRLLLADALGLPTFEADDRRFYERLTLIVESDRIRKIFYPILEPALHAAEIVDWLAKESEDRT